MTIALAFDGHFEAQVAQVGIKSRPLDQVPVQSPSAHERPLDEDDHRLRLIAGRDETAFRGLVERHLDRAFALARRILNNQASADDVVQDVLLKVWTTRGSWQEGRARFST